MFFLFKIMYNQFYLVVWLFLYVLHYGKFHTCHYELTSKHYHQTISSNLNLSTLPPPLYLNLPNLPCTLTSPLLFPLP